MQSDGAVCGSAAISDSPTGSDHGPAATGNGSAHDTHFARVIFGRFAQHSAQQEAVRSRHGSSLPQATHQEGRTILSASRPTIDKALASVRTRLF